VFPGIDHVLIFEKIKRVNVQVVDSTGSSSSDKIDIGFRFVDPSGKDVETLDPSNGGSYTGEASLAGDFSICLVHIFKLNSEFKFNLIFDKWYWICYER
jgi:hypothetical protein